MKFVLLSSCLLILCLNITACSLSKKFVSFYQEIGEKLSKIGGRLDYPRLTKELAQEIETLWKDAAIQVAVTSCN